MASGCLSLFLVALLCKGLEGYGYEDHSYCKDLRPQNDVDMSQIMGMWHGAEVISHLQDNDETYGFETCPTIHLAEITYEMTSTESNVRPGSYGYQWTADRQSQYSYRDKDFRHLRLYWDEYGNQVEYYLRFNNTRKGFWFASGPQNGRGGQTLPNQYNAFAGTVQVMKAVLDHLVLTFCQRLPTSEVFSIILTRNPQQLSRQEVHSIHNLLERRALSTKAVRRVCSGGTAEKSSILAVITFSIISIISKL